MTLNARGYFRSAAVTDGATTCKISSSASPTRTPPSVQSEIIYARCWANNSLGVVHVLFYYRLGDRDRTDTRGALDKAR